MSCFSRTSLLLSTLLRRFNSLPVARCVSKESNKQCSLTIQQLHFLLDWYIVTAMTSTCSRSFYINTVELLSLTKQFVLCLTKTLYSHSVFLNSI